MPDEVCKHMGKSCFQRGRKKELAPDGIAGSVKGIGNIGVYGLNGVHEPICSGLSSGSGKVVPFTGCRRGMAGLIVDQM